MLKKILLFCSSMFAFCIYMLITDPFMVDSPLQDSVPYGKSLILMAKLFLLVIVLLSLMHIITDSQLDSTYGVDEKQLVKTSSSDSSSSAYVLISRSIRYLANAVIILGVLIYLSGVD